MTINVIGNKVLVSLDKAPEKTAGGLILAEASRKAPNRGTVVKAGTGRKLDNGTVIPLDVKDGDAVLIQEGAGINVEVNGEKYIVVTEDEILAVFG